LEYKKCRHSVKRVISLAKEKKQMECAGDLNDPAHRNFPNGKADGKRKTGFKGLNCLKGVSRKMIVDEKGIRFMEGVHGKTDE